VRECQLAAALSGRGADRKPGLTIRPFRRLSAFVFLLVARDVVLGYRVFGVARVGVEWAAGVPFPGTFEPRRFKALGHRFGAGRAAFGSGFSLFDTGHTGLPGP